MNPPPPITAAIGEWQRLLGDARVLVGEAVLANYGSDASGNQRRIPAALKVGDRSQIAEIMRIANRHRTPVYPISTGKNWGYGTALPVQDDCVLIDLSDLRQIIAFDAEFGVVTVEPGVTQQMLADFLDAGAHPFLVPVTGAGPQGGLLGNALERGYGVTPQVDHFGAVTDLEAVLADGSTYQTALREAGGEELARLSKWGIGPYSAGLFSQSGFGIVTQLTIALARKPETTSICLFSLRSDDLLPAAVERVRSIASRLPGTIGAINLMNRHRVLAMAAPYPHESIGDDGLIPQPVIERMGSEYQVMPWTGFCTLYGTSRVVAAAKKRSGRVCPGWAAVCFSSAALARDCWVRQPAWSRAQSASAFPARRRRWPNRSNWFPADRTRRRCRLPTGASAIQLRGSTATHPGTAVASFGTPRWCRCAHPRCWRTWNCSPESRGRTGSSL